VSPISSAATGAEGERRIESTVRGWLADLREAHPGVEYRIGAVRIDSAGKGLFRARFELDRRALDEVGVPHIARREHTWLVRDFPGQQPLLLRIDERQLLPFPGTGPRIVCY
jgi:hypothetical protein